MPNRILKDTICVSKDIAKLSWFEEVFYYRLIVTVDDYGCYYADPAILRGKMFPRDNVTDDEILQALIRLQELKVIRVYCINKENYVEILAWEKHQTRRAKHRKYPNYVKSSEINCKQMISIASRNDEIAQHIDEKCMCNQLQADDFNCKQMQANVPEESRNRGIEESRNRGVARAHTHARAKPDADDDENDEEEKTEYSNNGNNPDTGKTVVEIYMEEVDPLPSPRILQHIDEYLEEMEPEVLVAAFERSRDANARNWKYVNAILNNWKNAGIKTMAAVESEDIKHAYRKNTKNNKGASKFSERADRSKYADVENKRVIRLMGETEVNA